MTLKEVLRRVAEIREQVNSDERAHAMEDSLYADVLAAIAVDPKNASRLAKAALDTKSMDFDRWYA